MTKRVTHIYFLLRIVALENITSIEKKFYLCFNKQKDIRENIFYPFVILSHPIDKGGETNFFLLDLWHELLKNTSITDVLRKQGWGMLTRSKVGNFIIKEKLHLSRKFYLSMNRVELVTMVKNCVGRRVILFFSVIKSV